MWPRTDLLDLLKIDYPILQAPMGGAATWTCGQILGLLTAAMAQSSKRL
jgi:hypothetical protein